MDSGILGLQNYLTAELQSAVADSSPNPKFGASSLKRGKGIPDARVVAIDFDAVPIRGCRDYLWRIGTSWTLEKKDIERLIELPKILLARSHELGDFYMAKAVAARSTSEGFATVCGDIGQSVN
jgi:hypothetical protein